MERINYHHLFLFWVVAKEGSFTRAGERLSISQSAITAQIRSLEDFLDVALFDRSNRRKPTLSEEGQQVLSYADSIFEMGDELLKFIRGQEAGDSERLRIGALSGMSRNFQYEFLAPLHADEDVTVEVVTGDQEKLVRMLSENALDLFLSSHNVPSQGKVQFHSHVLTSSPVVFVAAARGGAKRGDLKTLIASRPLYIPGRSFETRPELDAFLNRYGAAAKIKGEIDDIALLRIFALKSDCLVAIPELGVRNDLLSGDIKIVGKATGVEQRFYAISRRRRFNSPRIQHLVDRMRAKK